MNPHYKKELLKIITLAAKDEKLLDALIQDLLTPEEYRELANRWQIVKRLSQGTGQRIIARELKVGLATVTRGVHVLENENGGFNKLLTRTNNR